MRYYSNIVTKRVVLVYTAAYTGYSFLNFMWLQMSCLCRHFPHGQTIEEGRAVSKSPH
jgi:hypothetical protein